MFLVCKNRAKIFGTEIAGSKNRAKIFGTEIAGSKNRAKIFDIKFFNGGSKFF
jgi:hypothetical protein